MANTTQTTMFGSAKDAAPQPPVECLGIKFPNDEARRRYFLEKLREKLKDPAFRNIEGFPIGEDEDILALSDPPYYTACPNPFVNEFVRINGTLYDQSVDNYAREPFAADVSEGKNDPIYNAHSYHTKVPHKAIMRYILHYTNPGDLVYDGFCGTGMTGVAARLSGDRTAVESLGYDVKSDGTILLDGKAFSMLGSRRAVLGDLSPAATLIASTYNNSHLDAASFREESERILAKVDSDCGWMYLTLDRPKDKDISAAISLLKTHGTRLRTAPTAKPWGRINYTVWSDVFLCGECSGEVVFWDVAVDKDSGEVRDEFECSHCRARLTKRSMDRAFVTVQDSALNKTIQQAKQVPVLINYTVGKQRLEKIPDDFDRALHEFIQHVEPSGWFPTERMPDGDESRRNDPIGITHIHQFYTHRSLLAFVQLMQIPQSLQHRCALVGGYRVGLRPPRFSPFRGSKKPRVR